LLVLAVASTQVVHLTYAQDLSSSPTAAAQDESSPTPAVEIPTMTIPQPPSVSVPTVTIPQPTPVPTATPRPRHHRAVRVQPKATPTPTAAPQGQWITAYLTSYCPASAGWLSSSGVPVFYGMLANNFYPFGTHVYIPVLGITGVVMDHLGGFPAWNHFDVWSPTCYSTPTGYFPVAVQSR
jgi:hypothetical protein